MDATELFEILVREHAGMLTAYLRSVIRDRGTVDDLFQETLLTAWKRLDDYDRSRPFGVWLRGIAGKLMLADRRKRFRSGAVCDAETLEYLSERFEGIQRQPGDTLDDKLECLRTCIAGLPEEYRAVIQMRYTEELPAQRVAERLTITVESFKKRLQRGRERLLECLKRKLPAGEVSL